MNKSGIIAAVIGVILAMSLVYLMAAPTIKMLSVCEERGWDGSEYNTGVRDINLFEESEYIIVKCNKAPKETDAMIDVLDALPGINIKGDALVSGEER